METNVCYEQEPAAAAPRLDRKMGPRALPKDERPRERLQIHGPQSLSDQELLAVVLNTGIRGKNVSLLAGDLLERLDAQKEIPTVRELVTLSGLGEAKAGTIAAMLEFGRRRWGPCGVRVQHPSEAYALIRHHADRRQERFICMSLNGAHEVLAVRIVTIGLVNRTVVHPREVFADPLTDRASAVIVAHNHPSGRLQPSAEDEEITGRLRATAEILGISLLDHLIFSESAFYSFSEDGKLV